MDLQIIKPGQVGKGILIEYDAGYVSPKHEFNSKVLRESKDFTDHSKPFVFYATLQKWGVPNRNGRVYPEKILRRESEKYQDVIKRGMAISELNHPESSLIDLDRVSHIINEIWWDGPVLMGKLRLLTSPGFHERGICSTKGDLAANYLRQGVTLGISSRGVGSLAKKGDQNEVQDDFELICFDLVSSPSTPGAYLFSNPEDRSKYEENLEEEKRMRSERVAGDSMGKSVDLMKRLSDYLGK